MSMGILATVDLRRAVSYSMKPGHGDICWNKGIIEGGSGEEHGNYCLGFEVGGIYVPSPAEPST